ncbi:phosphate regulon sensor histidine kinase PhoR [Ferrimonas sp. SCSIO 43195]|uniref:phosphate regulon sensor histidine kinase PhoR n=1 Tax=Ferrimonas sp. SCSIO 43195 TaxID=2822844 RepID=UPI002075E69F|nr:phosphate regulon sensor histidine kinase PhoR [Ferrimonas sp. SCSIO 43195]USD38280.1 phosphate regulon sensor histidine kinase PhoR [Ferrimonas sp. SCSIO 43195]
MFEEYSGYRLAGRLAIWFSLWGLLGLLLDQLTLLLLIGTWVLLGYHYRHLSRLAHWLWKDRRLTPPHGSGSWEPIFNGIYRLQGKNRRRRSQLARLLSRFREGAEALPDAAVVMGHEGQIAWCNKLAELHLGIHWPQDAGQRIDNLIRYPAFSTYLHSNHYDDPIEMASSASESRLLEIRIMAYGDNQKLLLARDVTRLRQLEAMRRDFVANVSHELKTPLTVLQGYLEMMAMSPAMDAKQVSAMTDQTQRMKSLVDQLLTLSKIEVSTQVDPEHRIDMTEVLNQVHGEAQALSAGKHQLVLNIEPGLHMYGDELQIRSACANLVQNAVHYSPAGTEVRISWQRVGDVGRFEVQDCGDGIALEHIPRLTERFYRVDRARSRQTGGSGLGLAIVKHALNHHNSQLDIRSTVGKGSTFGFSIPANLIVVQQTEQA